MTLFIIGIIIYFLPYIVAISNKKTNSAAILVLNLFLGWTLIGWVVALVWATTKQQTMETSNAKYEYKTYTFKPGESLSEAMAHLQEEGWEYLTSRDNGIELRRSLVLKK